MRYQLARAIGLAIGILLVQLLERVGAAIAVLEQEDQAEAVAA